MRDGKPADAWFYPKSLSSCMVELDQPVELVEGETLSVLRKKGKNARVLFTGNVWFVKDEKSEDEINVQVDYSRDF